MPFNHVLIVIADGDSFIASEKLRGGLYYIVLCHLTFPDIQLRYAFRIGENGCIVMHASFVIAICDLSIALLQ